MIPFIQRKSIKHSIFQKLIEPANASNVFSNYGPVVQELENTARDLLKIDDSKAVIATSNGTTALAAMIQAIRRKTDQKVRRVCTQDFTFPTNSLGPAEGPIVQDLSDNLMIDYRDLSDAADIVILTNCFGHVYDINQALENLKDKVVIFDNAATPYSFYRNKNCSNYGLGSFISLHHTKPIGFGEGGLAIIDRKFEEFTRAAVNFGMIDGQFNENGGNYKMSEISAAAILQWWEQLDITSLAMQYRNNYFDLRYKMRHHEGIFWPNFSDDFFPNCLPFIHDSPTTIDSIFDREVKKYYKPLRGFPVSSYIYDRISCIAITENL